MQYVNRRKYDKEFKHRTVPLSYSAERTIKDTAASLDIHVSLLNCWRKKYTPTCEHSQLSAEEVER